MTECAIIISKDRECIISTVSLRIQAMNVYMVSRDGWQEAAIRYKARRVCVETCNGESIVLD